MNNKKAALPIAITADKNLSNLFLTKIFYLISILSIIIAFFYISPANAQERDQVFKDWTVYTTTLEGKKMCYIASFAKKKTGNYTRRSEPFVLVTRINNNVHEVSVSSGYPYKANSKVKLTIDSKNYYLPLIEGERAWAKKPTTDKEIITRMISKSNMQVKGISSKGTYSIDTFSLSGFTAAYNRMNKICK